MGVEGYYIRIAPPEADGSASPSQGFVPIKNRPDGQNRIPTAQVISPDYLALVRFGLRAPDDPRIVNTIKVIDTLLRARLPQGPCWYRYNGDGYGEHEDGRPFDGTGVGRPWPLLAGERAHYELAAGHRDAAEALLGVMEGSTAGSSRLIPEQVWDGATIEEYELFPGKPTGSACPLVWAHAEYVKLRRSLRDGKVFDQPPQTAQRYMSRRQPATFFPGGSTTRQDRFPAERICGSRCLRPRGCTGAWTTGLAPAMYKRPTLASSCTTWICRPANCRLDGKSYLRSSGPTGTGKAQTLRSSWSNGWAAAAT